MCNALTVHLNDEPIYDIFFANDFNSLPELLAGQELLIEGYASLQRVMLRLFISMRSGISLMENAKN